MSRFVPIPKIGVYGTDLPRELSLFESNVVTKLRADDDAEFGPLRYVGPFTTVCNARPWDILAVNPTAGALTVLLPSPDAAVAVGSWIGIKNDSDSSNTITVKPLTGTIDGAGTFTILSARKFQWFYSTGIEWKAGPDYGTGDVTIGPFTISTDQTTYSPTGWSSARYVLLNPTIQTLYINSFSANVAVKRKTLINVASSDSDIRIRNNSFLDATASNRVILRKANHVYLIAQDSVDIWHDDVTGCWRPV